MKIWPAFPAEFDQRQKTGVKRVASREPCGRAPKGTLESGKQTRQRSTSSGHSGASAGATKRGRLCPHGGGWKPTRRQATYREKSCHNVESAEALSCLTDNYLSRQPVTHSMAIP
jgi:hypothetical protein